MPNLYAQLYRRHGTPDGITRREMLEPSLGAAPALRMSDSAMALPGPFMDYREGALNSGAAAARRIAVKDGVLKGAPA